MFKELGYQVIGLHRTSFAGINLTGLSENRWLELNQSEKAIIDTVLKNHYY